MVEGVINDDFYELVIGMFTLHKIDYDLFNSSKKKDHMQFMDSQKNRKPNCYMDDAFMMIEYFVHHQEFTTPLTLFCIKQYQINKSGPELQQDRSQAALYMLSLLEVELMQKEKPILRNFMKKELIPLIMDENQSRLLRIRAIWVVENYLMFLERADKTIIMRYFGQKINEELLITYNKNMKDLIISTSIGRAVFMLL